MTGKRGSINKQQQQYKQEIDFAHTLYIDIFHRWCCKYANALLGMSQTITNMFSNIAPLPVQDVEAVMIPIIGFCDSNQQLFGSILNTSRKFLLQKDLV